MQFLLLLATVFGTFLGAASAEKTPLPPAPLDPLVLRPEIWTLTPTDLEAEMKPLGLEWTSTAKDTARSARPGLTLGGNRVYELLIRFREGKVGDVTVIYYNRGDASDLGEKEFEALLESLRASVTQFAGTAAVERGKDATSAVRAEGAVWQTPQAKYLLEWSATKESRTKMIPFRAEFVRLNILPPGAEEKPIGAVATGGSRDAVKRFVASEHIAREPGGTVKLKDVPMVDQGQKGYCVVASVERVMRYYGADVDQHELAQIANSDAAKGTSPEALVDSLKKLTGRLGVKTKVLYDWNLQDFLKLVEDYNRAAKRAKAPQVVAVENNTIDLDRILSEMKPEIFKEIRLKKAADFGKFQREIQRSVDSGIPLLWSLRLGVVPEKGIPQKGGGHMRLIIGYDPATKEILYSDSWGLGHEEKRMGIEDAWTVTMGLTSLQPIGT
jgi:hypothetical protein